MARSLPDCRPVLLLLVAGTLAAAPARVTVDKETPIQFEGGCFRGNFNTGTLESCDVTLRQGTNTVIKAKKASAKRLDEGYNGEWQFTGQVHIEFDEAILDADSATVVFADNRLKEVHVRGASGAPARFSHQVKDAARRNQGRAAIIDYEAASSLLHLSGDVWYSDGRNELNVVALIYNLNDGSFSAGSGPNSSDRVRVTIRPDKRVPPPRTPDRASSQ